MKPEQLLLDKTSSRIIWVALVVLMIVGFCLRWSQISYGLPAARHPDSVKTVSVGIKLAEAWKNGQWTLDPGHYQYPTFYPYLLAFLYYVHPPGPDAEEVGRGVTMIFGWLLIPTLFFVASRLGSWRSGIGAAFLVTLGYFFMEQGRIATPDAVQAFWMCLALACWLKKTPPSRLQVAIFGLLSGLAMGTKYTAVLLLGAFVVLSLFYPINKTNWKQSIGLLGLWAVTALLGFLISTPTILTHYSDYWNRLQFEAELQKGGSLEYQATGWSLLFSQETHPVEAPAFNSLLGVLGWPFVLTSFVALLWAAWIGWNKKKGEWLALSLGAFLYFLFFAWASQIQAIRFLLPMACILVCLTAVFLEEVATAFSNGLKYRLALSPGVLLVAFVSVLLFPNISTAVRYHCLLKTPDSRLVAAEWIIGHVPQGASLLNFMYGPSLPRDRYRAYSWAGPNFVVDMERNKDSFPTLDDLQNQGIEWVLWNHFYGGKFLGNPSHPKYQAYFSSWQEFYRDLNNFSERVLTLDGNGLSPNIEIYRLK